MGFLYCDNLEPCPKCGSFPDVWEQVWRLLSLKCECGNNYGGIIQTAYGIGAGEELCKKVYQQWQDGVRKELKNRKLACKYIRFKTQEEMVEYHNNKLNKNKI